ncbi:hypothetical protein OAM67_01635, partial [bacterium]|nr:hypothetical protein [bacterium]
MKLPCGFVIPALVVVSSEVLQQTRRAGADAGDEDGESGDEGDEEPEELVFAGSVPSVVDLPRAFRVLGDYLAAAIPRVLPAQIDLTKVRSHKPVPQVRAVFAREPTPFEALCDVIALGQFLLLEEYEWNFRFKHLIHSFVRCVTTGQTQGKMWAKTSQKIGFRHVKLLLRDRWGVPSISRLRSLHVSRTMDQKAIDAFEQRFGPTGDGPVKKYVCCQLGDYYADLGIVSRPIFSSPPVVACIRNLLHVGLVGLEKYGKRLVAVGYPSLGSRDHRMSRQPFVSGQPADLVSIKQSSLAAAPVTVYMELEQMIYPLYSPSAYFTDTQKNLRWVASRVQTTLPDGDTTRYFWNERAAKRLPVYRYRLTRVVHTAEEDQHQQSSTMESFAGFRIAACELEVTASGRFAAVVLQSTYNKYQVGVFQTTTMKRVFKIDFESNCAPTVGKSADADSLIVACTLEKHTTVVAYQINCSDCDNPPTEIIRHVDKAFEHKPIRVRGVASKGKTTTVLVVERENNEDERENILLLPTRPYKLPVVFAENPPEFRISGDGVIATMYRDEVAMLSVFDFLVNPKTTVALRLRLRPTPATMDEQWELGPRGRLLMRWDRHQIAVFELDAARFETTADYCPNMLEQPPFGICNVRPDVLCVRFVSKPVGTS